MVRRYLFVHQQAAGALRPRGPSRGGCEEADVIARGGLLGVSMARCPGGGVSGARWRHAACAAVQAGEFSYGRTGCRIRPRRRLFAERASLVVVSLRTRVLVSSSADGARLLSD